MRMLLHRFELPLRHVFTISRGSSRTSPTLVVELQQDGKSGFGEAGECGFYGATVDGIAAALERVRPLVEETRLEDPVDFWHAAAPLLASDSFAQCALDEAAHGKRRRIRDGPFCCPPGRATGRNACPPGRVTGRNACPTD